MKNFTKTITNKTLFKPTRWLIMALMLLVGTSSAWGWTIYYDNSGTPSWSDVYIVIGHDTWWKSYKMTKNNNVFQYTDTGWDDATFIAFSNSHKNSSGGNNTDWNSISNIRFGYGVSHVDKHVFTTNSSKLVDITHVSDVLNGNVIGFYVGEYTSWNQQQFYVKNSSITIPTCLSFESESQRYGVVYASSLDYKISHGDGTWDGPTLGEKAVLGTAYLVTSNNAVSKNAGTLPSCTFSIDNTIKAGETSTKSVTSSGKSKYGTQDYAEDSYYVKKSGETALTKLEVVGNELQTQSLSVGEYTIYLLLFDGRIYAKGGEQTLTVETACDKPNAPVFGTDGVEVCEGTQVTLPTITDVNLKWYDNNNQEITDKTFNAIETQTYYAVVVGDCESDKTSYTITIKTKPTVTLNPNENTVCADVTLGDITDYVEIESTNGSQISWYAAAQGGDALATSTPLMETSYFAEATFNGCSSDRAEFTITDVLSAPTEVPNVTAPETICDGESAVLELNNKGANYTYSVNGEEVDFTNNEYTVYPTSTTDYTVSVENKCGSLSTTKTIAVNLLPTITSISASNDEPVPFEDVVLTATDVTQGAEVKWYLGNDDTPVATGTTYVVTSENAGDVTVKAKAFLNGCESAVATKTVAFSAENCTPVVSNDIQIKFYHPSAKSTDDAKKGQWWGMGTLYYSTNNSTWSSIDMGNETSGTHTETISNISKSTLYVYFQSYWTYSHDSKAKSNTLTLERGKKYDIKITRHGDNNINATATATETGSLTQNPEIKAPAVKMVSAEYNETTDKIDVVAAIYKRGCDDVEWGFQYSEDGTTWSNKIYPNSHTATVVGEVNHSFSIDGGEGNTYYIRAYAKNSNSEVTSANTKSVEIPSSIIESATISLVDSDGDPSDDTEVCPQSTVYLKVSYVGGDFTDFVAEEDFPGTDLELENHDKTNNYAIFSFTATAAGTANITISNKSGSTVTPAKGVSITLKDVQVVTPPIITINPESAMICQGDDATISIVEENQNYTYTIYKDGEALNPQSFTITEAGVYTVGATENECNTSATSMPIELKVVSSDVKIGLEADNTAIGPWQPLKLTVTPAKGYEYTLEGLDGMVYTKEGDVYTIKIPRPNDWSPGNSGTQLETENKVFTAKIKVSDEVSCGSKEVTVTLTDTEENCE